MNLLHRLNANPYMLLPIASLCWAGNSIVGRLAVGEVTPMTLSCLRWVVALLIFVPFKTKEIAEAMPLFRRHWKWFLLMAGIGFIAFNALIYTAARYTGAMNLTMLQAAIPVLVLLGGVLVFKSPVTALQVVGTALTIIGVAVVASHGDPARLLALELNRGDVYMLLACVGYAIYTLALRTRPDASAAIIFIGLATASALLGVPLMLYEVVHGEYFPPTLVGWLIIAFAGLGPSLIAQIFYMRGVALIGPARAGLFINLVPIFGAVLAVALLSEPFGLAETLAVALVLGGVAMAEIGKKKPREA